MNYLVDTHYLIWSLLDPQKMAPSHRAVLVDVTSPKFVSKISYWEIALKFGLGKLQLKGVSPERLLKVATEAGYEIFDMDLPRIRGHRVKQYLEGVGNDNGRHKEEIHQGVQA